MKFIVNLKIPFSPLPHQPPAGNTPEERPALELDTLKDALPETSCCRKKTLRDIRQNITLRQVPESPATRTDMYHLYTCIINTCIKNIHFFPDESIFPIFMITYFFMAWLLHVSFITFFRLPQSAGHRTSRCAPSAAAFSRKRPHTASARKNHTKTGSAP